MDDRDPFQQVLQVAKLKLLALDRAIVELEKLKVQRETWSQFISITEAILDGHVPLEIADVQMMFPELLRSVAQQEPAAERPPEIRQDRLWKVIQLVLQMHKRPMHAAEVLSEVLKTDRDAVRGDNQRETIRGAMTRKPEIFERVGRGVFALVEWPQRLKVIAGKEED